jgi:hypothetical protein
VSRPRPFARRRALGATPPLSLGRLRPYALYRPRPIEVHDLRPRLYTVLLAAAWLVSALSLSGCRQKPVLLRLYFTTDVSGFLTPCG